MDIENYRKIQISDLKRCGMLKQRTIKSSVIRWKRNDETTSEVFVVINTTEQGDTYARFVYDYDGQHKDCRIALSFAKSNLPKTPDAGYYYFVCPVTGRRCRDLYFVNGDLMSRAAFRPLYWSQMLSKKQRQISNGADMMLYAELLRRSIKTSVNNRMTYNGKPTLYAMRVQRINSRLQALGI